MHDDAASKVSERCCCVHEAARAVGCVGSWELGVKAVCAELCEDIIAVNPGEYLSDISGKKYRLSTWKCECYIRPIIVHMDGWLYEDVTHVCIILRSIS